MLHLWLDMTSGLAWRWWCESLVVSWNFNLGALKYYRCLMMSLQDSFFFLSGSQTGGYRKGIVDCCSCLAGSVRSYSHQKLKFALHLRFWSGQSSSYVIESWYVLTLFRWFICFFLYCWLLQVTHSYWWIHTPRLCHCIWCVFVSLQVCQKVAVLAWAREHYIEMEEIWGNLPCSRPLPWTTAMFLDGSTEGVATHYSWHTFRAQKTHLFSRIQDFCWQNSPTSSVVCRK